MATTFVDYTGDGNATKQFTFPSIQESDIKVDVDGVIKSSGTHYNITGYTTTGGGNVVFTSGNIPASPAAIRIFRDTNVDTPKATYTAGSSVKAADLNANHEQLLFAAQEEQTQTVLTTDIKDNAVTTAKIQDGNVTTAKIADSAITSAKIADNAVTMAKLGGGTLPSDITVNSDNIVNLSVATADIAADAITGAKIADDSINSEHYVDGSIDTAHIADSQVTTAKIADTNVTDAKLASNSVTSSKITDANVTTVKIADSNVTLAKLANDLKQTTVTDDDTKLPTSGAIVDYVALQLSTFGGFSAIANETQFPNTQSQSGATISIADAAGIVVNGSGTSTTGRTVGGSTVTINNIPSNFYNSTVASGVRFIVTSTGSGQVYNYHKATLAESDLVGLSGQINDFSERYRVGSTNPTTNNDAGDLFFNTGTNKLLVYNGTSGAFEETQSVGNFFINTLSSSTATGGGSATPNGTAYRFTLNNAGQFAAQHLVSVNGVIQKPNDGTSQPSEGFAISSADIIFSAPPVAGASIFVITIGASVGIGTPSDGTVTAAKIGSGAVETAKIADAAVTTAKIAANAVTNAKLGNLAVTSGNISPDSVTDAGLSDHASDNSLRAVGTNHIKDEAVTLAKLEHGTGSNNGKFLRANANADPSFESLPATTQMSYPNGGTAVLTSTNDVVEISGKVNWDNDPNNTYGISFDAPTTLTKNSDFTLPEDGSNGQFLKTNGSGVLSFDTIDLTNLNASNLSSGTIPDARFPLTLPAVSGANLTGLSSDSLVKNFTLASGASTTTAKVINTNQSGEVEQLPQMSSVGTFITATDIDNVVYSKDLSNQNYRVKFAIGNNGNRATITLTGQILAADGTVTSSGTTATMESDSESGNDGYDGGIHQWYGQYWIAYAHVKRANNGSTSNRNARVAMQMFTVNQSTGAISMLGSKLNTGFNYYASALGGNAYTLSGYVGIYMGYNTAGVYYYYQHNWRVYRTTHYKLTTSGLSQIANYQDNTWGSYTSSNVLIQYYPTGRGFSAPLTGTKTGTITTSAFDVSDFTGTGNVHAQESSTSFNTGTNAYSANGIGKFLNGTHFIYFYKDINNRRKIQTYSYNQNGAFTLIDTLHYETADSALTADQIGAVKEVAVKSATEIAVLTQNSVTGNFGLSSVKLDSSYNIEGIKKPLVVAGTVNASGHQSQNHGLHYSGSGNVFFTFNTDASNNRTIAPYTVNSYKDSVPFIYGGIAQQTTSSGTAKIALGGVATGFSGLTVGTKYYVDPLLNGDITTASTSGIVVGTAIKATEMLIGDVR